MLLEAGSIFRNEEATDILPFDKTMKFKIFFVNYTTFWMIKKVPVLISR